MKKTLLTLALVLTVGFTGFGIAHAAYGSGGCNGPGGWAGGSSITYEEMDKFHNDTAELRNQLYEKRTEYYDVLKQEAPDKELAQTLWSEIYDLQNEMHQKALASGMMQGNGTGGGYADHMMWW